MTSNYRICLVKRKLNFLKKQLLKCDDNYPGNFVLFFLSFSEHSLIILQQFLWMYCYLLFPLNFGRKIHEM